MNYLPSKQVRINENYLPGKQVRINENSFDSSHMTDINANLQNLWVYFLF